MVQLSWLPPCPDFRARLKALGQEMRWADAVALASTQLDFVRSNALDQAVQARFGDTAPDGVMAPPVRLAVLGSSTLAHLHAGLRVAGLRRGLHVTTHEGDYGQYWQELADGGSALHGFKPNAVLFAFDAAHVTQGLTADTDGPAADAMLGDVLERIVQCWGLAKSAFGAKILQQAVMPVFPSLLGQNEHRLPGSRAQFVTRLNAQLRARADEEGVDIVAVDEACGADGLSVWHDPALWCRSKQEVAPGMAPTYGDLVLRVIASRLGRSFKCLVLDLDNTLWGGVIGDDGMSGIVLGQGSALGEGFVAVQDYAKALSRRGIILAVVSKNDEANAREPFEQHPDMVLRMGDIACFKANWTDKATNLRAVAEELNIGLDSLVFLDDNPFERNLVRQELPMVAVPEVPDDEPALVPYVLSAAGYFESAGITADDRQRTAQYQENRARESLKASATDLDGYLRALDMKLHWGRFDAVNRQRIVQLINKTNQFNLTTRRHGDAEYDAIMNDPHSFGLHLRLLDRFGDNGIIAVVIGRMREAGEMEIDTWLMSCRVLGRQVEAATLNLVAAEAKALGATRLAGVYLPTKKNGMVREHYAKLGFAADSQAADGASRHVLDLTGFTPAPTFIDYIEI